jgi:hypothetical protein
MGAAFFKRRSLHMPKAIVAIQLDAVGFVDEGVERVLDTVERRASVNTLLLDVFWFSRRTSERELQDEQYRGHGGLRLQEAGLIGGHFGCARSLGLPSPRGTDILAAVISAARKRGLRVFATVKDGLPDDVPGRKTLLERDFNGQRAETSCKGNPRYREMLAGVFDDLIRSYGVDGIMYMAERQGAFSDTLGVRFRGIQRGLPGSRTCFCDFCQARGRDQGLRYDRVLAGFRELEKFVAAGRSRRRPTDGYYVNLWRLMLRYPELLAWEHLWFEGLRQTTRSLHAKVKSIAANVLFGSHLWPNMNMSPLLRAEHDIAELTPYHDFLKVAMYHNCGGPRMASYIESVSQTMCGDIPPEQVLSFHYRVLNYDEAPYAALRNTGLKGDFVFRETQRVIEGARGSSMQVLAGIDVDIPVLKADLGSAREADTARSSRESVRDATAQALRAGAHGLVVSREYTEMQLDHLSGVGDAIRAAGLEV